MGSAFPALGGVRDVFSFAPHLAPIVALLLASLVCISVCLVLKNRSLRGYRGQLRLVLDNMNEGIVILDREGCIVLVSTVGWRAISASHRVSYDKIYKKFEAFSADGKPLARRDWPSSRALRGDFVTNFPMLYRRKGSSEMGSRVLSTAPAVDEDGVEGRVVITYRDDSDRRRSDEAHTRLAAIVESSADAIISKDIYGVVTSWNHAAETIFGYTAEEMIGNSIKRLLPPERAAEEDDILVRILRGESVQHFNAVRTHKDGHPIQLSICVSPVKDATGKVIGASKIARDITATIDLERQLQQAHKMEAVGQLTGGIAHDFNNLLGIIIGSLDLIERLDTGDEATLERIQIAQKAALRGADLTRRLLAFSSEQQLAPVATSLDTAIQNTIDMATRVLGPEIALSSHIDPAIPFVLVDPAGLEGALLNLAVNARDAMPAGGSLRISATVVQLREDSLPQHLGVVIPGPYACVSVSDTGHGMTRETLERAFEPFFTTKSRGQGTGLGLAMVYGFARQSNAIVLLHSEPGCGTTVSLYLPLAPAGHPLPAPPVPAVEPVRLHTATVLLVDDEPDLLALAVAYLTRLGYTVLQAHDGIAALTLLSTNRCIDIMVTDIIMPGSINGVELARKAGQLCPAMKIVFTSGYPADALARKSFGPMEGRLLRKPYRIAELSAIIHRTLLAPAPAA
jgi:PAS domain S-box-containing protein